MGGDVSMIHIKEDFLDTNTIAVIVDGVLDQGTISILEGICDRHLHEKRKVILNLEGVVHVTREGRRFLHGIHEKVSIANLPEFVKLEHTQ
jgi:transcription elongation factor GreA-like protein